MDNIIKSDTNEAERVSYWLEKLHKQREDEINPSLTETEDARTSEEAGKDEFTRAQATKKEVDKQTVNDLVSKSNRSIISISSLFPWDLLPNTISVEENRVAIVFRQLLASQSHSIEIKDITNVFIKSSLFLATLQIVSRTYVQNDIKIGNLPKEKAYKVQRIIEGLRTFKEYNINTSNYEVDELIAKIEEFNTK